MNLRRRISLHAGLAAFAACALKAGVAPASASVAPSIQVWKDPNCGCCVEWVKHLQAHGFAVRIHDVGNDAARARLGIPPALASCHTAEVAGYAIEGHVPAPDIKRLLAEKPAAVGLAVPGMPIGSPGMEVGDRRDPYDVLLVDRLGGSRVYRAYR
jgi:hypothetical protein